MNGGDAVVDALIAQDVDVAFTVPGESFLNVLEALRRRRDAVRLVSTRHEAGAAFAAEAFGRLAARPAAVFVSRGPGATNASIGVHTAMQGSTPLLLFVGHVRRRSKGREAFQEIDPKAMFAPIAKAVLEPDTPEELAAIIAQAAELASAGRPGPVVISLPRDLTESQAPARPPPAKRPRTPIAAQADALAQAAKRLAGSRLPLVIAGELVAFERAQDTLVRFVEVLGVPVMSAYRQLDVFPNTHSAYAGHLGINRGAFQREALAAADLIVAIGSRLDGISTEDYTAIGRQPLLHIYPDETVLRRSQAEVALCSDSTPALTALARDLSAPPGERLCWRDDLHRAYLEFSTPGAVDVHGALDLAQVAARLRAVLPEDAILLTDGGSFARWFHRYFHFTQAGTYAGPVSGAMGYAVPGALGAILARPAVPVVAVVGDGGFMMTGQELVTAVEQGLAIKVILCDNKAQGSILLAQRQQFGEAADYGTRLRSPDFVTVAQAYGAKAWRVDRTEDFDTALAQVLEHEGPALLHLLTDQRDIAPLADGRDAV